MFENLREKQKAATIRADNQRAVAQAKETTHKNRKEKLLGILSDNYSNLEKILLHEKIEIRQHHSSRHEFYIDVIGFGIKKLEMRVDHNDYKHFDSVSIGCIPGLNDEYRDSDGDWTYSGWYTNLDPYLYYIVMWHDGLFSLVAISEQDSNTKLKDRFLEFMEKRIIFREFNLWQYNVSGKPDIAIREPRVAGGLRGFLFGDKK